MYQNGNPDLVRRFEDWWRRDSKGLPLMRVMARRDPAEPFPTARTPEEKYTDADYLLAAMRHEIRNYDYLCDSYASLSANFGPGSISLYLGAEPRFRWDTVWYEPCIADVTRDPEIAFDPQNQWWRRHLALIRALVERSNGEFIVDIPDLIENLDIYAAMRGPQNTLFDIMDDPEMVERTVARIDEVYFEYYDAMYDLVRDASGVSSYTAFQVLGRGRVAKVQCDFSAMISPAQFRRFVVPSLTKQVERLDHSIYHLDGPDAIKHVPALMEIEKLDALQWTCGAGKPDGAYPGWDEIYDQVAAAGKGLWVQLYDGGLMDWLRGAERLIERYGARRLYLHFPYMSQREAEQLLTHVDRHWL